MDVERRHRGGYTLAASAIAAQLYTLREYTKTPDDVARTLEKVRAIGYEAVQLSALGPIEPDQLGKLLDENGLTVCATHTSFDRMRDELDAVAAEHAEWNCKYVVIGGLPAAYRNAEGYSRFAKEGTEVARALAERGLVFGYHNHAFELEAFYGRTGLATLYDDSDQEVFTAEIDTYWIQFGGGDPAWWIERLAGRTPLVHLKDMTIRDNQPIMAEVGEGNMNFAAILEACRSAGVEWYIVEQDHCERDPFESLAISLRNLREMGLQ